jgi:hypothetical protein
MGQRAESVVALLDLADGCDDPPIADCRPTVAAHTGPGHPSFRKEQHSDG